VIKKIERQDLGWTLEQAQNPRDRILKINKILRYERNVCKYDRAANKKKKCVQLSRSQKILSKV
jgi:hypothetical protein